MAAPPSGWLGCRLAAPSEEDTEETLKLNQSNKMWTGEGIEGRWSLIRGVRPESW